jgi:UDP-2,3-diacylglucosamine pyrophosphatase LpxH
MLDAVIVSDLHLGAANSRHRTIERVLWQQARRTDRIIFNGDLVDHWSLRRWPRRHLQTLDSLRRLSQRVEIVWVAGNHEESSTKAQRILDLPFIEEYRFVSAGVPVLCQHGHQYDNFIRSHPIMTWLGDLVYCLAQKIDPTHRFARYLKRHSKLLLACAEEVTAGAVREARRGSCGLVTTGHTHLAGVAEMEDGVCYGNAGCWTEKPATYLTVQGGLFQLHSVP